ncbi:hypothetical protein MPF19_18430 [Polaribacter sp. Z014]|uniref:ExbD/TolR family protein n=1 Tax=Polaribacter sp. Z014 TaxID=2927126 RepID=UPI00201FEB07|nr:hypothetical protein [Polaribacter sp. Z014]MCL7765401.1 hypothetical protein [Polaribacter sp. Z014]
MRKRIYLILLFVSCFVFGQEIDITLPKSYGNKISFSNQFITPLFNVYLNKNGKVRFENIDLSIEQLGDSIHKYVNKLDPINRISLIIQIYADKDTYYSNVEKVKSQMTKALALRAMYRTGIVEDINSGIMVRLNGTSLDSDYKLLESMKEINQNMGVGQDSIFEMIDNLYELKFNKAKAILKSYKYKKMKIYSNKKLIINGEKYNLNDMQKIFKELKNVDFIITYLNPKMTYDIYLKNLALLKKVFKENNIFLPIIEISRDLEKIMKKRKQEI